MKKIITAACILTAGIVHAQNTGIGTLIPPAKLTILGAPGNPTIPGLSSTGVLRLAISDNEGIDFGKITTNPFTVWLQAGFDGITTDPISLQPLGGNVGIGTLTPTAKLEIAGQVKITGGTPGAGKILTSDATGLASWQNAGQHFIGESYGGGIVFYVYDNGQHGLIAATADQSAGIIWYNGTNRVTATAGDGLRAGEMNSSVQVSAQIADNQAGNFAAKICADYAVTVDGILYGDWYLPSKYELNLLRVQQAVVGGIFPVTYWSSTEISSTGAWVQSMPSGAQFSDTKNIANRVRAIRSF
jgi:hypothetical protein